MGRPTVMTSEIVAKLEEAFAWGCSDTEACLWADIAPATLYKYQDKNPEFTERKASLKEKPILLARQSVIKGMRGSPELALKFLERRKKDEFSIKTEVENSGEVTHKWEELTDEELERAIQARQDRLPPAN